MELVRQVMHALADAMAAGDDLADHRRGGSVRHASHLLEIDLQQRHLLADVVVQLARDPGPLRLLRLQNPATEIANAVETGTQRRFALPRLRLGLPASR